MSLGAVWSAWPPKHEAVWWWIMADLSTEHEIADLRERLARLESTDVYHRLSLERLERDLATLVATASSLRQEAVGVVLSTRSEMDRVLEEHRRKSSGGSTESAIKIALAIIIPLLVLVLTRDPQQAAGVAKSLLSPGTVVGH